MKVCIVGAGAIGGLLGARLAASGQAEVSVIARGLTLEALRSRGWRLQSGDEEVRGTVRASSDPRDFGPQDLVIVAVKGQALPQAAQALPPLLAAGTVVLPAMNGVPWWFGHGVPGLDAAPLQSVDPGGTIAAAIPYRHVVGCVVHASASAPEPGLVRHNAGRDPLVGEPAGGTSARVQAIADRLISAGFDVRHSTDVRYDVWYKLWGNLTMNPVSALTGATTDRILADPLVRTFCADAMREVSAIGARIGCPISLQPEDRQAVTAKLGAFKTSMLQDAEAGRPLELDAIVGAAQEIGRRVGEPTPNIDALLGLTRLFGRVRGIYPEA